MREQVVSVSGFDL